MAWNAWRPVESQPPPGLAGSITLTWACAAPAHNAIATANDFSSRLTCIPISLNFSDCHHSILLAGRVGFGLRAVNAFDKRSLLPAASTIHSRQAQHNRAPSKEQIRMAAPQPWAVV